MFPDWRPAADIEPVADTRLTTTVTSDGDDAGVVQAERHRGTWTRFFAMEPAPERTPGGGNYVVVATM